MAVTLVQGSPVRTFADSGTSTPSLAYASAVTSGNTLILFVSGSDGQTISSVDDSLGQTWTLACTDTVGGIISSIYYKLATGAGTPTVTVHLSGASSGIQLTLFEIAGTSLAKDVTAHANGGTGVSNAGNLNTTMANAFLLAGTENLNGESTVGSSMTFLQSANGSHYASCQYRIVSATSNYATAFATDTGGNWATVAAAFGESGGGGGGLVIPVAMACYRQRWN